MRAVIQRVRAAQVEVEGRVVGACEGGLFVLLGVMQEDTREDAEILAKKIVQLRIFEDENDKMNLSLLQTSGGMLVVSNFTLAADCTGGRRPNFFAAMSPQEAEKLYLYFTECCRAEGVETQTGVFGAHMHIKQHDDGPVTILLDSGELKRKKS